MHLQSGSFPEPTLLILQLVLSQMRDVSEDFKAELGRANYVTPTSYLQLITMFQRLVTAKRIENSKTLSRYTVGLDKLQSSAQQVAGMQQELRVSSCHS